jgi:hypothetical protein
MTVCEAVRLLNGYLATPRGSRMAESARLQLLMPKLFVLTPAQRHALLSVFGVRVPVGKDRVHDRILRLDVEIRQLRQDALRKRGAA